MTDNQRPPREAALINLEEAVKVFEESEPSYADGENMSLQAAHFWSRIYVGDQLARIADMIAGGFKLTHSGDTFGDNNAYIEPGDPK